jgi:hypothetical protein
MATVLLQGDGDGAARLATEHPAALVISIGAAEGSSEPPMARVGVSVRDEALGRRLTDAMTRALRAAVAAPPREIAVVRVRSRKGLERLGARVAGAIAVVPVTARNLRRAGEIVEGLRTAGAAGVQLVWDGSEPPRQAAEAKVFAILEKARATPGRPPVVLSRSEEPAEALRILVDVRR